MLQPVSASEETADQPRAPRHWPVLALTFVLLFGALSIVAASALPAVARELGWTHARTVSREGHRAETAGRAGIDAVKEREQKLMLDGDDDDDAPPDTAHVGISVQPTTMFHGPGTSTGPVGSLDVGEKIVVVREDRGFVLVVRHGPTGTDVGWVRKSDVLVR